MCCGWSKVFLSPELYSFKPGVFVFLIANPVPNFQLPQGTDDTFSTNIHVTELPRKLQAMYFVWKCMDWNILLWTLPCINSHHTQFAPQRFACSWHGEYFIQAYMCHNAPWRILKFINSPHCKIVFHCFALHQDWFSPTVLDFVVSIQGI